MISQEDYAKKMRLAMCNEDIVKENGDINHEYFLSKKNHYWSKTKQDSLIKGIEKFGVGNWEKIRESPDLNQCYDIELQLRTCVLLDTRDLSDHMGKKYSSEDIRKMSSK